MKTLTALILLFIAPTIVQGADSFLGVRFGDTYSKVERSLVAKYGIPVQDMPQGENGQNVAFKYQDGPVFLLITYRKSDGRIMCLSADGGVKIKSSAAPLPGGLNLEDSEAEIEKRLGKADSRETRADGFTHYDYKGKDISFETKEGKIFSYLACQNETEVKARVRIFKSNGPSAPAKPVDAHSPTEI